MLTDDPKTQSIPTEEKLARLVIPESAASNNAVTIVAAARKTEPTKQETPADDTHPNKPVEDASHEEKPATIADSSAGSTPPTMSLSSSQADGVEREIISQFIGGAGGAVVSSDDMPDSAAPIVNVPWTLQQFFNGEIDLDIELMKRFPNMPLLSNLSFRSLGNKTQRGVALMASQDNATSVTVDINAKTKEAQFAFSVNSMLGLRFRMHALTDMDRARWMQLMRREQGGLAFLWGQERWARDYIICIKRDYYTSMLAFSPNRFEAAVRLTPDVSEKLLDWLQGFWGEDSGVDDAEPDVLTW